MPERTKKDQKQGRESSHKGSRWHNFHFSGKLISCSVIFGFLLILIGGIILAIGIDRDEESKSDDYGDLQKKPPLVYVGPAIMGIGGFTVIVGIIMCLVETKVFRRRAADVNPLINSEEFRNNETINGGTDPTTIPSDSKHKKHRHGKSSHRKAGNGKKSHSSKSPSSIEASPSSSSEPIGISGKGSRNFLNASDTFLTPPGSFTPADLQMQGGQRDAVIQTSASLMKSFNSSGTYSAEFQTPSASFVDTPSFPSSQESTEVATPKPFLDIPGSPNVKSLENVKHEFLTPQNSNADILESPKGPKEIKPVEENSPIVNRHVFLTPKNSTDLLEESPPTEETLEDHMGNSSNHPETLSKKSPDKVSAIKVVADIHEPPMQLVSGVNKAPVQTSVDLSKPKEIEHSDIKVDVLIDAIDEEVKGNAQNEKEEESGESSENIESNCNSVTENVLSVGEDVDEASEITEENKLKDTAYSVNKLESEKDFTSSKGFGSGNENDVVSDKNDK